MKPIKKGMTEAVTRDGRKVTQLTWFDGVDSAYCLFGVLDDGYVKRWTADGRFFKCEKSDYDLFAPVEYEWQWLVKNNDGTFDVSAFRSFDSNYSGQSCVNGEKGTAIWYQRIEESKREVQA